MGWRPRIILLLSVCIIHSRKMSSSIASRIQCPAGIVAGNLITKELRQEYYGRIAGGAGSRHPENYQRTQIELGTGVPCVKTSTRINKRTNEMRHDIAQPMKRDDGFDWTEDFDGKQAFDEKEVFINLKSVVGTGGSQTRTLRDECYPFIEAQLQYLLNSNNTTQHFANIFDGDEAAAKMRMYNYLLNLPEYATVRPKVYVGDLRGYFSWLSGRPTETIDEVATPKRNYIAEFIASKVVADPSGNISKAELSTEFKMWFNDTHGRRGVPNIKDVKKYMDNEFKNEGSKGWTGVRIDYEGNL